MKAAFFTRQGPAAEVFEYGEQPTPQPAAGEVLVRLSTSGVNPSDWKMRRGARPMAGPLVVPHSDGAGVIDAVGAGVPASRVGERVWIWNGQWARAFGTAAQYIALPSAQAVHLPDNTSFAEGACLGIPAFTACQAVRRAQLSPGATVLVAGGAGSVGHYAIQMARAAGARVLTTISSDAKAAHALAAGADLAINYRTDDVGERVKAATGGRGVDAVIEMDLAANAALYPQVLRPHGTVAVYGTSGNTPAVPAGWLMFNSIDIRFVFIYELSAADRQACIADITRMLEAGTLRHTVARQLPLAQAAQAHDLVEQGQVMGNVVLDIS